ncbi:MAG: START domain-containing protein [Desulfosudaceae bacterium]
MTSMAKTICLAAAILLLMSAAGLAESEWEHLYTKDGIEIYKKTFPGTDVCAFKGVGFVDAKMEVIGCVLRDIPSYPQWMAKCKKALVLKDIDRNTKILYNAINAPFPYKDRDMVVKNETLYHLDNGTAEITFGVADDTSLAPPTSKYVRVEELSGRYLLEFFGREKTRLTYLHRAHPGGNIPVSIANRVEIRDYPYTNIKGLRKMVKKQEYIEKGAASPEHDLIEKMGSDIDIVRSILKKRVSDYLIDPELLKIVFRDDLMRDIVTYVHAEGASFKSIQQAVLGMFSVGATSEKIEEYIADKDLDEFFSIDKLMEEKWLIELIAKNKGLIEEFLDANSSSAEKMFHKITTCEKAVQTFIKDEELARTILTDPEIRRQLWEDDTLRREILENIGSFDDLEEFEDLVEDRVEEYSVTA